MRLTLFLLWLALLFASSAFYARASVAAKRRWHPAIVIVSTAVVLAFIWVAAPPGVLRLLAMPAIAAAALLSLKYTMFCSACGAMVQRDPRSGLPNACPKCGHQ